ncbi:hypothetical protein [Streptomyces sp. NPDC059092]|uniref:hypothetical protein n=1 Tax=Streptomyces sp. NPDC059092 TaxID=3346725 RepID=UPI0036BB3272
MPEKCTGRLGGFRGVHGPAPAQVTRDLLGWQPTRPEPIADLADLADLKEGHYFVRPRPRGSGPHP